MAGRSLALVLVLLSVTASGCLGSDGGISDGLDTDAKAPEEASKEVDEFDVVQEHAYIGTTIAFASVGTACGIPDQGAVGPVHDVGSACFEVPSNTTDADLTIEDDHASHVGAYMHLYDADKAFISAGEGFFCSSVSTSLPSEAAFLEIYIQEPVAGNVACFGENPVMPPAGGTIEAAFTVTAE